MQTYASLQIIGVPSTEAARDRMIYSITAYMDALGYISCQREAAEHTVAFVSTEKGWAVFDDQADRLDVSALNGLGRCLSGKLRAHAVGVMCSGTGLMLCLYADGLLKDTYLTSRRPFGQARMPCWLHCHGHALRWRSQLAQGTSIKELAAIFSAGQQAGRDVFPQLRRALNLDETAGVGFSSMEDAGLQGVVTLYFCPSNVVKQGLFDKLLHPARRAATTAGALLRRWRSHPAEK